MLKIFFETPKASPKEAEAAFEFSQAGIGEKDVGKVKYLRTPPFLSHV